MTYSTPKPADKRPGLFNVDLRDIAHGFIVSVIGTFLTSVIGSLTAERFITLSELKTCAAIGAIAGLSYLSKKLSTNNEGKLFKKNKK